MKTKMKQLLVILLLFSLIISIFTPIVYAEEEQKDLNRIDRIVESLNIEKYKDSITFLNDITKKLGLDTDYKSFEDFNQYADENYINIVSEVKNRDINKIYNNTTENVQNVILVTQGNQLYVVHSIINDTIWCTTTVKENYYHENIMTDISVLLDLYSDIHIYNIILPEFHLPLTKMSCNSEFGNRKDPVYNYDSKHKGIDLKASVGTPIFATEDGVVTRATYNEGGYGYYVEIEHKNGFSTLYAHCSELLVSENDIVNCGQIIAKSGNTGKTTGPHLHFEYKYNGIAINPRDYLQ